MQTDMSTEQAQQQPAADQTQGTTPPADKGGAAQTPDKKPDKADKVESKETTSGKGKDKVKTFDFNNLDLNGRMRTPQLLYFLERANEELERASLEKRSFIPHMVRSIEEEAL